jgi:hypothetical protein
MPPDSGVRSTEPSGDWVSFVTSKIEMVVSLIRDKALTPLSKVVHFAIFGLVALLVGTLLAVMFTIALIRLFDTEVFASHQWASYLVVAGIFALGGMLSLWGRSRQGRRAGPRVKDVSDRDTRLPG